MTDRDPVRDFLTRQASRTVWRLERDADADPTGQAWQTRHALAVHGLLRAEALVWPEDVVDRAADQYGGLVAIHLNLDSDYARLAIAEQLAQLGTDGA